MHILFLNDLAQEWVHDEDCTLLRSCSGRDQSGPYDLRAIKLGENLQEIGHMTHIHETNFVYAYKRQVISIEGVYNRAST